MRAKILHEDSFTSTYAPKNKVIVKGSLMARKEPLVCYQPDIETMSREDLEALQLERLQALVKAGL